MKKDSKLSLKTKKILAGIGIAFGTVLVFLISFTISFSLIINPISLFTFNSGDAAKENKELKETVETLNDEIEHLNATVDKYKASSQSVSVPATITTPQSETPQKTTSDASTPQTSTSSNVQNQGGSVEPDTKPETETENKFSPETVTGTEDETPEDIEAPITVIDISEQ